MTATTGEVRLFSALTPREQEAADQLALNALLEAVCEGAVRFNDALNGDDLQARIDAAWKDMEDMQTPWFIAERLMEDDHVAESLRGMARCDAEAALYVHEDGPTVVRLGLNNEEAITA